MTENIALTSLLRYREELEFVLIKCRRKVTDANVTHHNRQIFDSLDNSIAMKLKKVNMEIARMRIK